MLVSTQARQVLRLEHRRSCRSTDRRNPVLADVMTQQDYMEKRGSGLRRICNATRELDGYTESCSPRFKSTTSKFMTILTSVAQTDIPVESDKIKDNLAHQQ